MGVCGCVIPNPNCHCHFTPVGDWFLTDSHKLKTVDELLRLRQQVALLLGALNQMVRHHDQLTPEDIKQAKDAITKATGGE